jgi:hypothetical protein
MDHEKRIKGWLNIVMIKEFLTIRLEIDLNYIDITPGNAALFGLNLEEPLIMTLTLKEYKLLNSFMDSEHSTFKGLWNQGLFDFTVYISYFINYF